jgi:hypothetical protein
MKILLAVVVPTVTLGATHTKAELVSKKMLGSTEETKIEPNKVNNMSFLSRTLIEECVCEAATFSTSSCAYYEIQDCYVYCKADFACEYATIWDSTVFCLDDYSCYGAAFTNSTVECSAPSSCNGKFVRSIVNCDVDTSCDYAEFSASAIACPSVSQYYRYTYDQCSCCDGVGCPDGMQVCSVNGTYSEDFCSSQSFGTTCAAFGNPICEGMPGYSIPTQVTPTEGDPSPEGPSPTYATQGYPTTTFPTTGSGTNLLVVLVPVLVAAIGFATAWVQRKRIVNVYHHYRSK